MFVRLSNRIASKLEEYQIISETNRALYEYGLRQMFTTILNIITMLVIGALMDMVLYAVIYIVAYIPVRIYAGGYHASSPQRCWAFSSIILFIVLILLKVIPENTHNILTLFGLGLIIVLLSPVETKSKSLSKNERKVYRFRTIIVLILETSLSFILLGIKLNKIVITVEMAWGSIVVMLVLGIIKNCVINRFQSNNKQSI